jgi:hypothetical protein
MTDIDTLKTYRLQQAVETLQAEQKLDILIASDIGDPFVRLAKENGVQL